MHPFVNGSLANNAFTDRLSRYPETNELYLKGVFRNCHQS